MRWISVCAVILVFVSAISGCHKDNFDYRAEEFDRFKKYQNGCTLRVGSNAAVDDIIRKRKLQNQLMVRLVEAPELFAWAAIPAHPPSTQPTIKTRVRPLDSESDSLIMHPEVQLTENDVAAMTEALSLVLAGLTADDAAVNGCTVEPTSQHAHNTLASIPEIRLEIKLASVPYCEDRSGYLLLAQNRRGMNSAADLELGCFAWL